MLLSTVGVALGGGGARGIAHLGVLKHFEEIGIKLSSLSGTSAGSIVASLYAFGVPLETIAKRVKTVKFAPLTGISITGLGLVRNRSVEAMLEELLPKDARIEDSKIPLTLVATDLEKGKPVYMRKGDVISAVMASMAVPGIYVPVERDGRLLSDGGLTENVPVGALKGWRTRIRVGVSLNDSNTYERPTDIFEVMSNAINIAIDSQTRAQLKENADVVIGMDLSRYSFTSTRQLDELIREGQEAARAVFQSSRGIYLRAQWQKLKTLIREMMPIHIPETIRKIFKTPVSPQ